VPISFPGDVEAYEQRFPASGFDLGSDLTTLGVENIPQNNSGTFLSEQAPFHGTHTPCRATNQGDFACESHRFVSMM
jgi:hypothetical protein